MANQPGIFTGTQAAGTQSGTSRSSTTQSPTGVRDSTYNLISVIYHALQGAETYKMYEEDVERTPDDELAQFFRQACEEEKRRAQQGKELLARHLQKHAASSGQHLQQGSGGQQGSTSRGAQQAQGVSGTSGQQTQGAAKTEQMGASQKRSEGGTGSKR